ncbi:MAG: hypothetical protein EPN86_05325 [Nanoarchaeota archaeon]|nr:MAG: hypothetical protein EPN86_05325 [Nanoarchaeota archaeon]
MNCFDHGKEFAGLCGWCGKQVCPGCIGRQDGRKKYCRDCSSKMGDFKSGETSYGKKAEEPVVKAYHEDEQPRITPIVQKKPAISFAHPKQVDPRHFELDDVPSRVVERPQPIRPTVQPQNPHGLRIEPQKIVHDNKPKPQVGSAMGSFRDSAASGSSKMALGMFAQQVKTTAQGQSAPSSDSKPHIQTGTPVQKNAGTGAASKALSFLADSAKETAGKK